MLALNSIDKMESRAKSAVDTVAKLPVPGEETHQRLRSYVRRLIERITEKEM